MKAVTQPMGIEVGPVSAWFDDHVDGALTPLAFDLVAGGRSNLTYLVTDATGTRYILRRPPLGHVLATAHDMAREYRIITALNPTPVPVPRTFGLCDDPDVNNAPFYVMEHVDGLILRDAALGEELLATSVRPKVGPELSRSLALLHALTVDEVGLGDLAKREDYIARQIKRWRSQFEQTASAGVLEPGIVERAGDALSAHIPKQRSASIVHGDYRLDNTIIRDDGSVAAILDWELCTLGDPLADVGTLLCYWGLPPDGEPILGPKRSASMLPGFSSNDELLNAYAEASGRDVSSVPYYQAFGYWRLGCILQGVYARYQGGAGAGDPAAVDHLPQAIARLARFALDALGAGRS